MKILHANVFVFLRLVLLQVNNTLFYSWLYIFTFQIILFLLIFVDISFLQIFTRKHLAIMIDRDLHSDSLIKYANKCIELCWLFNIQDPPLCLLWAREGQRVSEHLRLYTVQGKTVSFNVWPSLLLHEGGPLLKRGVVQPYSN